MDPDAALDEIRSLLDDVTREALLTYRGIFEFWIKSIAATDAERELARIKIALIDQALAA